MGLDILRTARWLNGERLRGYAIVIACVQLAALAFLIFTARAGIDRFGHLLGTDFLSFWTTSSLLHQHVDPYDPVLHIAEQRRIHAAPDGYMAFFYPPLFLPFCYPLALLNYFAALALWLAATGAAYLAAVRVWLGRTPWYAIAGSPAVFLAITHGQTSFLVAGLLGGGAWLLRSRPALAGVLFGLATFKPQFGLLIPLVLVLTGEWRAITAAGVTALALALTTTLAFGLDEWRAWLGLSEQATQAMESGAIGFAKMQSPFAAAMLVGMPLTVAYAIQIAVGLIVAATIARISWRRRFSLEIGSAMLAGALLTTPFVLDYDLVLLAFPLAFLATRPAALPWEKLVGALAFLVPAFARPLASATSIPLTPLILLALFGLLAKRALAAPMPLAGAAASG
jgi:hypothetical protein